MNQLFRQWAIIVQPWHARFIVFFERALQFSPCSIWRWQMSSHPWHFTCTSRSRSSNFEFTKAAIIHAGEIMKIAWGNRRKTFLPCEIRRVNHHRTHNGLVRHVHVSPALAWHNYTACTERVSFSVTAAWLRHGGPITQLFDAPRASV
jgi:hypothetical protein